MIFYIIRLISLKFNFISLLIYLSIIYKNFLFLNRCQIIYFNTLILNRSLNIFISHFVKKNIFISHTYCSPRKKKSYRSPWKKNHTIMLKGKFSILLSCQNITCKHILWAFENNTRGVLRNYYFKKFKLKNK